MAIKFNRSQTFATNGTVTAAGLHNLIDGTDIYQALITDQTNLTSVGTADELLIADADLTAGDAPRAVTVNELFEDALTISTYTNANINNISYGTSTGTRIVSTNASITTGTIPNLTSSTASITIGTIPALTAGTTTSTAANITNGTVQTLTASTATITGGTFSGAINSTAGTIGNLTTTLAGDFSITGGTGTLGTTGVTAGTYGTNTSAVTLTLDAKGRITTVSTSAIPTTPEAGSITYPMLSTSGTESDNVAMRTARAWVKFNGTGAVAIQSDFNVSSITDNGTGDYTVNFSSALPDANYSFLIDCNDGANTKYSAFTSSGTSSLRFTTRTGNGSVLDTNPISVVIFGN
jgi:hypothetical protein